MQVDVGAGLVGGQRAAVEALELEQVGVVRHIADRGEPDLDQAGARLPCRRRRFEVVVTESTVSSSPRACLSPHR